MRSFDIITQSFRLCVRSSDIMCCGGNLTSFLVMVMVMVMVLLTHPPNDSGTVDVDIS